MPIQDKLHDQLRIAIASKDLSSVRSLLNGGANPNFITENQATPLYNAISLSWVEGVELLCRNGADVNIRHRQGNTPLHLAVINDDLPMVQCLLRLGADCLLEEDLSFTAYDLCGGEINSVIEEHLNHLGVFDDFIQNTMRRELNRKLSNAARSGDIESIKDALLRGADIEATIASYPQPLHRAISSGNLDCAKYLVSSGANINAKDQKGTPVTIAALKAMEYDSLKYLLEIGADINSQDADGKTLLHHSTGLTPNSILQYLVESGIDPSIKDSDGNTAYESVMKKGLVDQAEHICLCCAELENRKLNSAINSDCLVDQFKF